MTQLREKRSKAETRMREAQGKSAKHKDLASLHERRKLTKEEDVKAAVEVTEETISREAVEVERGLATAQTVQEKLCKKKIEVHTKRAESHEKKEGNAHKKYTEFKAKASKFSKKKGLSPASSAANEATLKMQKKK